MALKTRKPTGKPPWPILLIAGVEKSGKSYSSAAASASNMIGRTLWVPIGEDDPDELGGIDGARFEIVEHNGTYLGIYEAVAACVDELKREEKPGLIVLDSGTRLWNLLTDEAQANANQRAAKKAQRYGKAAPTEDVSIGMDLWNRAKSRWENVIDLLREHKGPSIITARLELVSVMNTKGEPTGEKDWKIQAHKSLPWDVGAIVQMPEPGKAVLTGVRSLKVKGATDRNRPFPDFTVEKLWDEMGMGDGAAERRHSSASGDESIRADVDADAAAVEDLRAAKTELWQAWQAHGRGGADQLAQFFADETGVNLSEATAPEMRYISEYLNNTTQEGQDR